MSGTGLFVTGTDTGVGKTLVSSALVFGLRARGLPAAGMKPVAAGARHGPAGMENPDAAALRQLVDPPPPYADVNPYLFEPPIAPHIAAARAGVTIDPGVIAAGFRRLARRYAPVVVEGAGGWLVPIDPHRTLADVAASLALPVVLVVGVRLGCINHALLTAEAVTRRHLPLAAWVATYPAPYPGVGDEVVATLAARLPAPLLGVVPYSPGITAAEAARALDLGVLEAVLEAAG